MQNPAALLFISYKYRLPSYPIARSRHSLHPQKRMLLLHLFFQIIRLSKMQHKYSGLFKAEQTTPDLHCFFSNFKIAPFFQVGNEGSLGRIPAEAFLG